MAPIKSDTPEDVVHKAIQRQIRACNEVLSLDDEQIDCFYVADMGEVRRRVQAWKHQLNRVTLYYAVKCNPNPTLLRYLSNLSDTIGFDCASVNEISQVLDLVSPSRIIFAAPVKSRGAINFAARHGVKAMTFDNSDELDKIAQHCPDASLYIRIAAGDPDCTIDLSSKYGAPIDSTTDLLRRASDLRLNVVGVAFHVGTGAVNGSSYTHALQNCMRAIGKAREFGHRIRTIDIGGGFTPESFTDVCPDIRKALADLVPPEIHIIAEPGRFLASTAFTLACKVIGKRGSGSPGAKTHGGGGMLYLGGGVYGDFMNVVMEKLNAQGYLIKQPGRASTPRSAKPHRYSMWGPTCDSLDKISDCCEFRDEVEMDDWVCFSNMGAYTSSTATAFNGISADHKVVYIDSVSDSV